MVAKRILLALCACTLFASVAVAEGTASGHLTQEEHAELLQLLDESRAKLMGLIEACTEEQWMFRQNPSRWSVGECTEHIVRSERALLDSAISAMDAGPDKEWRERTKGKSKFLRMAMPNRRPMGQGGATAPMEIRPSENWTKAQAIKKFDVMRREVRAYAEAIEKPIKEYTYEHPFPVFNWLSAYDWLIYIPLHTIRHSKQIIEVQEDENYPK